MTPETAFIVEDQLLADIPPMAEVGFLLHPSLTATMDDGVIHISKNGTAILHMRPESPLTTHIGLPDTPRGSWYSPTFGEKLATTRISSSGALTPDQPSRIHFTNA